MPWCYLCSTFVLMFSALAANFIETPQYPNFITFLRHLYRQRIDGVWTLLRPTLLFLLQNERK